MSKKKCNHLVGMLKRNGEWENITLKEYYQFFYKFGAITGKYDILSKINKGIRENHSFYVADALGVDGATEYNGQECLVIGISNFGFCPYCGKKFNWKEIDDKKRSLIYLARSRINEETVKNRFRKKKLEDKKFREQYRTERKLEREMRERKPKKVENIGYVYVAKLDKNYKVGISKKPISRLQEFTLLPYELETILIDKVKGYDKREKELHEHFSDKRVRGEWFELNEQDIEYIKQYLKSYEVK